MSARIDGLGVALIEVPRLERALRRFGARFERRLFSRAEIHYSRSGQRPAERLAARLAAKQALRQALRTPPPLAAIEVVRDQDGAPGLSWPQSGARTRAHLSLTHTEALVVACVWIESRDG